MQRRLKQLDWCLSDNTPVQSARRSWRCTLPGEQAATLVLAAAQRRGLRVPGFRPGRAPAKLVYAHHQRICDGEFVAQLHRGQPEALALALSKACTPPDFKAAPWDGESECHIDVSYFELPSAPTPDALANPQGAVAAEPVPLPVPGTGLNMAGFLPAALQAQGVLTGLHLQAGLGQGGSPGQHMGLNSPEVSGFRLPSATVPMHLPGVAQPAPSYDPRPAPAVPRAAAPEIEGPRPAPGGSARAAPGLPVPDAPRARANSPHVALQTSQPAAP
jgi:hypothetical protein